MTNNAHLGSAPLICDGIYHLFHAWLYGDIRHIHCPSAMIATQLKNHGYEAKLHVISNGVPDAFHPASAPAPLKASDGLIHLVTVGRLSPEKDQTTLIRAIAQCAHSDEIQLHICGEGPLLHHLEREGAKLAHVPIIDYLSQEDLIALLQQCPLYLHGSTADIEAISVIEAMACGCVPIIAQAEMSAPAQFALCPESLFEAGDVEHVASLIDWWIDHPEAIEQWSPRYAAAGADDHVEQCTQRFTAMLEEAIADDNAAYGL